MTGKTNTSFTLQILGGIDFESESSKEKQYEQVWKEIERQRQQRGRHTSSVDMAHQLLSAENEPGQIFCRGKSSQDTRWPL